MGHPKWTTPEQEAWLKKRIPAFIEAQDDQKTQEFFLIATFEWEQCFDPEEPSEKEIVEADGNVERVVSVKKKKQRQVRVMPALKEAYQKYLGGLEEGETPMSELAFNSKTAKEMLAKEPQHVHDSVESYREHKRQYATRNLMDAVLRNTASGDVNTHETEEDELPESKGELLMELMRNVDCLPATVVGSMTSMHKVTGWVGYSVFAGPHPRTGVMTTIAFQVGTTLHEQLTFSEVFPEDWDAMEEVFGSYAEMCFPPGIEKSLNEALNNVEEDGMEDSPVDSTSTGKKRVRKERPGKRSAKKHKKNAKGKGKLAANSLAAQSESVGVESGVEGGTYTTLASSQAALSLAGDANAQATGANSRHQGTAPERVGTPGLWQFTHANDSEDEDYETQLLKNIEQAKKWLVELGLKHPAPAEQDPKKSATSTKPSTSKSFKEKKSVGSHGRQNKGTSCGNSTTTSPAPNNASASSDTSAPSTTSPSTGISSDAPSDAPEPLTSNSLPAPLSLVPSTAIQNASAAPDNPVLPAAPMNTSTSPDGSTSSNTSTSPISMPSAATENAGATSDDPAPPAACADTNISPDGSTPLNASAPPILVPSVATANAGDAASDEPAQPALDAPTSVATSTNDDLPDGSSQLDVPADSVNVDNSATTSSPPTATSGGVEDATSTTTNPSHLASESSNSDLPVWMADAKAYLATISDDERWTRAVNDWALFEKALGYPDGQGQNHRLPAKNRPVQIRQWLKSRKYDTIPVIPKLVEYVSLGWWVNAAAEESCDLNIAFDMVDDFVWVLSQMHIGSEDALKERAEPPEKQRKVGKGGVPTRKSARH
ncbi:hypothetical protein C8Q78DRAFT_993146 [Trametes maxima]|nr:hypothetical protein C8Q78DRAFT_993146 [Trametes maxima]